MLFGIEKRTPPFPLNATTHTDGFKRIKRKDPPLGSDLSRGRSSRSRQTTRLYPLWHREDSRYLVRAQQFQFANEFFRRCIKHERSSVEKLGGSRFWFFLSMNLLVGLLGGLTCCGGIGASLKFVRFVGKIMLSWEEILNMRHLWEWKI